MTLCSSWNLPRAVKYREINRITGLKGTAVTVQVRGLTGTCFVKGHFEDCGINYISSLKGTAVTVQVGDAGRAALRSEYTCMQGKGSANTAR